MNQLNQLQNSLVSLLNSPASPQDVYSVLNTTLATIKSIQLQLILLPPTVCFPHVVMKEDPMFFSTVLLRSKYGVEGIERGDEEENDVYTDWSETVLDIDISKRKRKVGLRKVDTKVLAFLTNGS